MDVLQKQILEGVSGHSDNKAIHLLRAYVNEEILKHQSFQKVLEDLIVLNYRDEYFFRKENLIERAKDIKCNYIFLDDDNNVKPVDSLYVFNMLLNYVGYHWDQTQFFNYTIEKQYRKDVKRLYWRWKAILEEAGCKVAL